MTNEELAARIQQGETELLSELWSQTGKIVRWKAQRRAQALNGFGGVDAEDLYQCGYFALLNAVEDFDPACGHTFLTHLDRPLRTAFAAAAGYRTERRKRDPLQRFVSLDTPAGEDEDGGTLGDFQTDPNAERAFCEAEERELREKVRRAVGELPEEQRSAIFTRYWLELPLNPAEKAHEAKALRTLRSPRVSRDLREYL